MTSPWLSIVGLGEDGLAGLSPPPRRAIKTAVLLVGGARHLALVAKDDTSARRCSWAAPLTRTLDEVASYRGQQVCVLASGDPMDYGVGVHLTQRFDANEYVVYPVPGAFSLACARLGWARADVETLSLHGRPFATLNRYMRPGARLLILCEDGSTPRRVAAHLRAHGLGPSLMSALSHMGGPREQRCDGVAADWPEADGPDLVTVAVTCRAESSASALSRIPGLPDCAFDHDGQVTKRPVRAATLSALAPLPGCLLWDVGAGCGSISIEWLRAEPGARAIAIERDGARAKLIAANAHTLGVPTLDCKIGEAPEILHHLPPPDRVFIGGGLSGDSGGDILQRCWRALRPGGRLVANVLTPTSIERLLAFAAHQADAVCDFLRLETAHGAITKAGALAGEALTWRQKTPVMQMTAEKSGVLR